MRPGGGKAKGADFERITCRLLSLWVSEGANEDCFWRSAMSGGRSTVAARSGKRLAAQAGDISSIHQSGHALVNKFLIECKSYRDLNFASLLTGKGKLREFWSDTKADAKFYEKQPLLIARQNKLPTFVCLGAGGLEELGLKGRPIITAPKQNLYIVLMNDFLHFARRPM